MITPTKIICAGLNYSEHASEVGFALPKSPLIFLKSTSSIARSGDAIILPEESQQVEHEAELAVIIGAKAKNVSIEEARYVIGGYACANDVTARDIQKRESQWSRSKSFDTFGPIGEVFTGELARGAMISCIVNGEVRQHSPLSDMLFGVLELISFASRSMTLLPGDILLTGSPKGSSRIYPGDTVEVRIDGLPTLVNKVV